MRRIVLVVAAAAVAGGAVFAFWPKGPRPALTVTPSPVDFGEVPWMETHRKAVEIRNDSNHEVLLGDMLFNCTCFNVIRPADSVRLTPGQVTRFEVMIYTPKTTAGRFHKKLTIVSNDPVAPRLEVPLVGTITDFRTVTPREVALGAVDAGGDPVSRTIEVRGGSGASVAVVEVTSTDPRIETEIRPVKDGSDVVLRTRKDAAKGRVSAQVRLTVEVSRSDGHRKRYPDSVWVNGEIR